MVGSAEQRVPGRLSFYWWAVGRLPYTRGWLFTVLPILALAKQFDQAKECPLLELIPEEELISVLFQEAAPEARGVPCQKTRANQLDGTA